VLDQNELNQADCGEIISLIENNWLKNRRSNFYLAKGDFLTVLQRDYRPCVMSLNREQVVKLFGQPVEEDDGNAFYFLNEGCNNLPPDDCSIFIFYFDDEGSGLVIEYLTQPYGFSH
jgi:hypothetical protein